MDQIIWKVRVTPGKLLESGRHVTCSWNRDKGIYEVYFRGTLCGIVSLPWWESRRAPDFVMGEVIESGCIFAKIRVCTGRERNRSFAINRLFLPAGAKAAV